MLTPCPKCKGQMFRDEDMRHNFIEDACLQCGYRNPVNFVPDISPPSKGNDHGFNFELSDYVVKKRYLERLKAK